MRFYPLKTFLSFRKHSHPLQSWYNNAFEIVFVTFIFCTRFNDLHFYYFPFGLMSCNEAFPFLEIKYFIDNVSGLIAFPLNLPLMHYGPLSIIPWYNMRALKHLDHTNNISLIIGQIIKCTRLSNKINVNISTSILLIQGILLT